MTQVSRKAKALLAACVAGSTVGGMLGILVVGAVVRALPAGAGSSKWMTAVVSAVCALGSIAVCMMGTYVLALRLLPREEERAKGAGTGPNQAR